MAALKIQHKNWLQSTLRKKKTNTLFAGLGRSVLGKTMPSVLSTARPLDLWHSFSQYGPPGRQITYIYCTKEFDQKMEVSWALTLAFASPRLAGFFFTGILIGKELYPFVLN